jgi:hypothetical protein
MTQKTNSRVVIDTNKHGIRRETNLDASWKASQKKKEKKAYKDSKRKTTE